MSKRTYFQRIAREMDTSVPVLTPPRYSTRRMEIAQFELFAQSGANLTLPQAKQQARRQTVTDPAQAQAIDIEDFPTGDGLSGSAQFLPAAITGSPAATSHSADRVEQGLDGQLTRGKLSKDAAPLPSRESSRKRVLEQAAFSPAVTESSPVDEPARAPFPQNSKVAQSPEHTPFPPSQDASKPLSVAERPEPVVVRPFADMNPDTGNMTRRLSPISEKDTVAGAIADPVPVKEITTESSLESKMDGVDLKSASRNDETATIQPNAAMNTDVSQPDASKTPAVMELPHSTNKKSDNDNEAVRIGVLEITVASPTPPTQHAETDSAPTKLSWSRGISRANGLRQG